MRRSGEVFFHKTVITVLKKTSPKTYFFNSQQQKADKIGLHSSYLFNVWNLFKYLKVVCYPMKGMNVINTNKNIYLTELITL